MSSKLDTTKITVKVIRNVPKGKSYNSREMRSGRQGGKARVNQQADLCGKLRQGNFGSVLWGIWETVQVQPKSCPNLGKEK